ncbi:MAG TPA: DedA family protein [Gemmatimonadaceae bacterium]|nr:DedA family protein [Gemmatimonadaceae bacterium]
MDSFIAWLTSVPIGTLYAALGIVAAIENVFPPIPADTVVALGSFLAARGHGNVLAAFLATWVGNVASAMIMYAVGRRYGAERLERRLLGDKGPSAEHRLERLYGRYGVIALFASRFIPGVRAIVPPFAGALRVPPLRAGLAIGGASAIWYGTVSYLGFTLGGNWPRVQHLIIEYAHVLAIVAAILLLVGVVIWRSRSRKLNEH